MLQQPIPALHHPEWDVRPMTIAHISLVVSWMAFLDPGAKMDQSAVEAQLSKDINEAHESNLMEHRMGFFQELPVFYMEGGIIRLSKSFKLLKGNAAGQGYEISTLLINPTIENRLILPVHYRVIKFLFERSNILRIIISVKMNHDLQINALQH